MMAAGGNNLILARGVVSGLLDIFQGHQNFTLIIPLEEVRLEGEVLMASDIP